MALACLAGRRLAFAAAARAAAAGAGSRRLPLLSRAAASKAGKAAKSKPAEPEVQYCFDRAPDEQPLFPELLQPGRRAVLLAVDPDLGGAVAALSWRNPPLADDAAHDGGGTSSSSDSSSSNNNNTAGPANSSSSSLAEDKASSGASPGDNGFPQLQGNTGQHTDPLLPAAAVRVLEQLQVQAAVHDMPVEVWQFGKRDKKQPEAAGLIRILQRYTSGAAAAAAGEAPASSAASIDGSSSTGTNSSAADGSDSSTAPAKRRRRSSKAAAAPEPEPEPAAAAAAAAAAAVLEQAGAQSPGCDAGSSVGGSSSSSDADLPVVRAIVEYSTPPHASGKFAWYGIGFAVGLLNGLLAAQGVPYHRVPSSTWKQQMGLKKQGKEGSIALARHLLPAAADQLKRKKDHGRAEALLMAAWGLGVRMHSIAPLETSGSVAQWDAITAVEEEAADGDEE